MLSGLQIDCHMFVRAKKNARKVSCDLLEV